MRKIFSLFVAALVCAGMFAATETTVYYTAPEATIGDYTVKLNVHYGCDSNVDPWEQFTMTKTEDNYNGDPVYSASFTDKWDGLCTMQFQLYNGDSHVSEVVAFNNVWTDVAAYNGKMYVHSTGKWVTLSGEEVLPTVVLHGTFAGSDWADTQEFTLADDKQTATLKLSLGKNIYYFGVKENGSWYANGNTYKRSGIKEGTGNMRLMADVEGEYTFTWTYETQSLSVEFPLPAPTEFTLTNGYYLVGNFNDWTPSAEYLFAATETEGEYKLERTCGADTLKVVYVESDLLEEWYGENNYGLPESLQTKEATFYFRPVSNADWTALDGHLHVEVKEATGIDATVDGAKAVKVLRDGMLLIEKGGKSYNVLGAIVR